MEDEGRCAERNEEFGFRHARFEMPIGHPSRNKVEIDRNQQRRLARNTPQVGREPCVASRKPSEENNFKEEDRSS